MSLDYALYEELKRRRHRAARWWIVGDRLYYLGLIPGLMLMPLTLLGCVAALLGQMGWNWPTWMAAALVVSAITFGLALVCKGRAYRMAQRDGIAADEKTSRQ